MAKEATVETKERGKDEVINVRQRASIYQTIDRLLQNGLIGCGARI